MLKSYIQKGNIKTNNASIKKHILYTSKKEKEFTLNLINSLYVNKNINYSYHVLNKSCISFKNEDVKEIINNNEFNIISYDFLTYDIRALIRGTKSYNSINQKGQKEKVNYCIVLSLLHNEIVTIYYNKIKDNHKNINWNLYKGNNINIIDKINTF
jgi:hypothetical protein